MPDSDPKGTGHAVALTIPAPARSFLRRTLTALRAGLLGDLADRVERLQDPGRSRREADAFGRLLAGLDDGVCVPDPDVIDVIADLADSVDDANEYSRAVSEHEATHGLLDQLASGEES